MVRVRTLAVLALLIAGCPSDPDSPSQADGGLDASAPDSGVAIASPASPTAPSPPELMPCPKGWRVVGSSAGLTTCEPWPEAGPAECMIGQAHFLGEPGCAPVGRSCPVGSFPDDLPADRPVLYVLAGAANSGDGSRDNPFRTIVEAEVASERSTLIMAGPGTYDEAVRLGDGVELRGSCVARTVIGPSSPLANSAALIVRGTDVTVRDLQITGARVGIWLQDGSALTLNGVLVDGATSAGILAMAGSELVAHEIVVANTRSRSDNGLFGRGLSMENGAVARIDRALFDSNREVGVNASGTATALTLEDVAIRNTQGQASDSDFGRGLHVLEGTTAIVRRSEIALNRDAGLVVAGLSAVLTAEDLLIRGTKGRGTDGGYGLGLAVQQGGAATLSRSVIERNCDGVMVNDADTTIRLDDVAVRDASGLSDGCGSGLGRGLSVNLGATAELHRAEISRSLDVGVLVGAAGTAVRAEDLAILDTQGLDAVRGSGCGLALQEGASVQATRILLRANRHIGMRAVYDSSVALEDVIIQDTRELPQGGMGRGLEVGFGSSATIVRGLFENNSDVTVIAGGAGTLLSLQDVTVRDTGGEFGRGLDVTAGASASVFRALFERNGDVGLAARGAGTRLQIEDLVVRDMQGQLSNGMFGTAVGGEDGAALDAVRVVIERSREVGVWAWGPGTAVRLEDATIMDTIGRRCATSSCADAPAGIGAGAAGGAELSLRRFRILRSLLCGVQIADGASVDLSDGEVAEGPVGVCLQVDGYDVRRLTSDVEYRDNGINLDATQLVVPAPFVPAGIDAGDGQR